MFNEGQFSRIFRQVLNDMHAGPTILTEKTFSRGLRFLSGRDSDLANILREWGPPPMWVRDPGFPTLILIILEQQVSLASARAAFARLGTAIKTITPRRFLRLDNEALKAVGFSRQKKTYARHIAQAIVAGRFDPGGLERMDDAAARAALIQLKGIGSWSADIYLMMALRRPDIWPKDDLALATAVQEVKGLDSRPKPDELEILGAAWQPWRAVAARMLWHFYLSTRSRS